MDPDPDTTLPGSMLAAPGQRRRAGFCYAPARPQHASAPFPEGASPATYDRLLPLFEPQHTDASCSVASATLVLNALLLAQGRERVHQGWMVGSDPTSAWARATADVSCTGVGLVTLAGHVGRVLRACAIDAAVEVHHLTASDSEKTRQFRADLARLDGGSQDTFVVVNFVQSLLLGDGEEVGHMSVVGGFDAHRDRVLIFDVDPEELLPYWVDVAALMRAMATSDRAEGHRRGYLVVAQTYPAST